MAETPSNPVTDAVESGDLDLSGKFIVGSINIDLVGDPDDLYQVQVLLRSGDIPKQVVVEVLESLLTTLRGED